MGQLYRETVAAMPIGQQANLFWEDQADDFSVGHRPCRKLPMHVQARWHMNWRETLDGWIANLPKVPFKKKFPDIRQRDVKI
jgi:hypothetical protein